MDNYSTVIPNEKSRDDKPSLGDLYSNVVHQYAAQWEQLGLKLGLQPYEIDNISKDNAHNPDRSVTCCRKVLENWLQIVSLPTWGKLDDVIKSMTIAPAVSEISHKDGDYLKTYYKATRFTSAEETWPPEQVKHFTPVVLIRQEGQRSKKETEAMAAATSKGGIEEYLSTTTNKVTKDLQKVFSQLEPQITSCICQDGGKSVTILLDGYDELPVHLRKKSFIANLLERKVLPACSIVVSSRPHASTHLRDNISCQVEILGFSEKDQQHFMEHSLKDQPHKISELKQYLKNHSTISNLCYIPFNMTILLFLYKDKEERPLPTNSTGLYNLFICLTICRHLTKSGITLEEDIKDLNSLPQPYSEIINQLSKFAFKALGNNQLVFTLPEVKKECPDIDKAINGFGLLQAIEYTGRMRKSLSFNFIHLSIQEFLAAHYVTTLPPSKELSVLQDNFWSNPVYLNMFDIYVALTNGQQPSFKQFLQDKQPRTHASSLRERFKTFLFGREKEEEEEEEGPISIPQQLLNDKIKCLRIYRCFQEAGDIAMCKSIEDTIELNKQQINLYNTSLSPSDLECLTIFLACSSNKEWKELNLWNCHIQNRGLQILQHGLRSSDITITELVLVENNLFAAASEIIGDLTISCRVKRLFLSYNKAVGEDDRLYRIITDDSSMVEELVMTHIDLSSSGAIKLFTALNEAKKLRILHIYSNYITDEACDAIVMAMKKNTSLIKLNMYNNPISGECAQLIVQALQYNDTLQELYLNRGCPSEKIRSLHEEVNKKRETHGCQVKLDISFL